MSLRLGVLRREPGMKIVAALARCTRHHVGLVVVALVAVSPALANTVPGYPLRNGTFSS